MTEQKLKTVHCGDEPGAAARAQLCVSHLMSIQMLGWLETRSLGARLGLAGDSVDALIDQIPKPTLGGGAPGSTNVTVEMMESQLRDAVESARKVRAPVPVGALAAQIYGMVGTGGYIDLDYSVVDQAVYAIAKAETGEQQDPVALSVDTIQQSLDVSHACHAAVVRISCCARPFACDTPSAELIGTVVLRRPLCRRLRRKSTRQYQCNNNLPSSHPPPRLNARSSCTQAHVDLICWRCGGTESCA